MGFNDYLHCVNDSLSLASSESILMESINVWLAYVSVANDKFGMGCYRDVYCLRDTAAISYSYNIWISKIEE